MGFGVSGSTAIVFLGLFICAGTLYTAAAGSAEQVHEATDDERERLLDRQNTDFTVTNATYDASNGTLSVEVENAGASTLSVNDTTLLVDNRYRPLANVTVDGVAGTDVWAPGSTLELRIAATDPNRTKVVTGSGVADATGVEAI